jgi:hypothetical protein
MKDKDTKKEYIPEGKLLKNLLLGKPSREITPTTREDWLAAIAGDIDPAKYSGEGWFATDEYARPEDIYDPYVRAQIGAEEEYYPEVYRMKRKLKH